MNKHDKLVALVKDLASERTFDNTSLEEMEAVVKQGIQELVCNNEGQVDFFKWEQNHPYVMELIATAINEKLPKMVNKTIGQFAAFKTFKHGEKPRFMTKLGRKNVKRFVTKVAAAGNYERVRLDRDYFDVEVYAHGGAVYQTLEGFLAGRENLTEVYAILLEEIEMSIYQDITTALQGTYDLLPAANKHTHTAFVEAQMKKILATVSAYGNPTIFCTRTFANNLTPATNWISEKDRGEMRDKGYLGKWNGADVVILPQSFTDTTNTTSVLSDAYAYIIPSGSGDKVVNVGLEGGALVKKVDRGDWSAEIQTYQKLGIAILHTNHFGMFRIGTFN